MNVLKFFAVIILLIVGGFFGLRFMFVGRFILPSAAEYDRLAKTGQGLRDKFRQPGRECPFTVDSV